MGLKIYQLEYICIYIYKASVGLNSPQGSFKLNEELLVLYTTIVKVRVPTSDSNVKLHLYIDLI